MLQAGGIKPGVVFYMTGLVASLAFYLNEHANILCDTQQSSGNS